MEAVALTEDKKVRLEDYQAFVARIAGKIRRCMGMPYQMEEELYSAGCLGLVQAAEKYDFTRGGDFRSFAYIRIRGAIIDSIRDYSELSRKSYRYARALEALNEIRQYEVEQEAIGRIDLDAKEKREQKKLELARILEYAAKGAIAYRMCDVEVEEEMAEEGSNEVNPEDSLLVKERRHHWEKLIETLPEKEAIVIREFYFNEKTFQEIADQHPGMSKSWVSKLHNRALEAIKYKLSELGDKGYDHRT